MGTSLGFLILPFSAHIPIPSVTIQKGVENEEQTREE
jgi:hypothetical protein